MSASLKFIIMAGGTGGHVFPALAVAHILRDRGHEVVWMGAPDSFEARTVPSQGFKIEFIQVAGLRGKGISALPGAPLRLLRSLVQAWRVLSRHRPNAVLGMGGFAAGPGGLAAWIKRIPLIIHEQNAAPGLTNRLLSRVASQVLQAFPDTFANGRTLGNPVRDSFTVLPPPRQRFEGRTGPLSVLVIGGSQGAKALNERVPQALALIPEGQRPRVRHQGGRTLEVASGHYAEVGVKVRLESFIEDVADALGSTDLLICRAGASTIAELSAVGCASLLVPFPFAVDDHQTRNGQHLVSLGAARMIQESELSPERLAQEILDLTSDRTQLVEMAERSRTAAWPDAGKNIADCCVMAAGGEGSA